MNDLISNNQLNICSEEKVFMAVLNWIKHDLVERKKHIYEVSATLYLHTIEHHPILTQPTPPCLTPHI